MSRRHIVLARAQADVSFSFRRADHPGEGGGWRLAVGVSDSPRALIDGVLSSQLADNLTISPRAIDDFLAAPPEKITVPSGLTAVILMPVGQPDAPHAADLWVRVVSVPAQGHFEPVKGSEFMVQTLTAQLRELLNEAEIKSLASPIHRSEIWVRPRWSSAQLFPLRWPAYVQKTGMAPARWDGRTEAQVAEQARKNRMAKEASHKGEAARIFNEAEAKRHAAEVVAADQAARAPKKKR